METRFLTSLKAKFACSDILFRRTAEQKMTRRLMGCRPLLNFLKALLKHLRNLKSSLYLVGGTVRDIIEDTPSIKDIDLLVTGISFEELGALLSALKTKRRDVRNVISAGKHFPVYKVSVFWSHEPLDIALARTEKSTGSGHCDFEVFSDFVLASQDSSRRDFTINALFYKFFFKKGKLRGKLTDYQGGLSDLRQKKITAVGDPYERFKEDPLRMLRALRQKNQRKGFLIEKNTVSAIKKLVPQLLLTISPERIAVEIVKSFNADPVRTFFDLSDYGILRILVPELFESSESKIDFVGKKFLRICSEKKTYFENFAPAIIFSELLSGDSELEALNKVQRIISRLHLPNQKKLFAFLNSFVSLLRLHLSEFPLADAESNLCDLTVRYELITLYEAHCELHNIKAASLREITILSKQRPPYMTGTILQELGALPGPAMKRILLATREYELSGELKTPQAIDDYAINFYKMQEDRND